MFILLKTLGLLRKKKRRADRKWLNKAEGRESGWWTRDTRGHTWTIWTMSLGTTRHIWTRLKTPGDTPGWRGSEGGLRIWTGLVWDQSLNDFLVSVSWRAANTQKHRTAFSPAPCGSAMFLRECTYDEEEEESRTHAVTSSLTEATTMETSVVPMVTRDKHVGNINPAPQFPRQQTGSWRDVGGGASEKCGGGVAVMNVIGPFSQILMSPL